MKCELLKDFPFAKAGTIVELVHNGKTIQYKGYQCDIVGFENGWIKQVPREYYVYVDENDILCAVSSKKDSNSLDNLNWTEIKVREAL